MCDHRNSNFCSSFLPDLIKEIVAWDGRNKVIPKGRIKTFIASKASLVLCLKHSKSLCLSNFVQIHSHNGLKTCKKLSSNQERMLSDIIKWEGR
jgi:hypothetical protein